LVELILGGEDIWLLKDERTSKNGNGIGIGTGSGLCYGLRDLEEYGWTWGS